MWYGKVDHLEPAEQHVELVMEQLRQHGNTWRKEQHSAAKVALQLMMTGSTLPNAEKIIYP